MTSAAALNIFPILAKNIDLEPIFIAKLAHNYVICAPFFACAYIIVIIKHLVYKNKNVAFSKTKHFPQRIDVHVTQNLGHKNVKIIYEQIT